MLSETHKIFSKQEVPTHLIEKIDKSINSSTSFNHIKTFIEENSTIPVSIDKLIIKAYATDWSNIKGYADILVRPKNKFECAMLIYIFYNADIQMTISGARTNLTGSATPLSGAIILTDKMVSKNVCLHQKDNKASCLVGTVLEDFRDKVKNNSNQKYYYPVDPTSRRDATIGGTISCNASGFIPGDRGATRYWVNSLHIILTTGKSINVKRGQYISRNGQFIIDNKLVSVPKYKRPKIKNASGPFSYQNEEIDIIDLFIGSEGIFGMIVEAEFILDKLSKNNLDFFIPLDNEDIALDFRNYIFQKQKKQKFIVNAFEYFGFNCQKFMNDNKYFFENEDQVGIYMQIPLYDLNIENSIDNWYNILKLFNKGINLDKVILLNDNKNWKLFFNARHSIPANALAETIKLDSISMITDTIVPEKNFNLFLKYAHNLIKSYNIEYLLFGHLGDCHLHFHLIYSKLEENIASKIYRKIIKKSSELDGVYSAEHGTGKRKRNDFIECYGIEAVEQVKLSKIFFDSKNLLNRGNIV